MDLVHPCEPPQYWHHASDAVVECDVDTQSGELREKSYRELAECS